MNRFPAYALAASLSGCSFGPPNLAPVLHDPRTETRSLALLGLNAETARSFRLEHPNREESDDDRMEFLSFRMSMAGPISHRGLLIVPYLHNVLLQPGLGLGIVGDRYYGLLAAEAVLLKAGEVGLHSPRLGGQLGFRIARRFTLTYDYYHLTYSDYHAAGYGVSSWFDKEYGASRIGFAFGDGIFLVPSVSFVHGARRFGMGVEMVAAAPGRIGSGQGR